MQNSTCKKLLDVVKSIMYIFIVLNGGIYEFSMDFISNFCGILDRGNC